MSGISCEDRSFIQKEPGLWVHHTGDRGECLRNYVRQATIPQGISLVARGTFSTKVEEEMEDSVSIEKDLAVSHAMLTRRCSRFLESFFVDYPDT
jgi:hypothetical protein